MYRKAKEVSMGSAAVKEKPSTPMANVTSTLFPNTKQHCGCSKTKIDPKTLDEEGRTFLHIAVVQCGDNDCLVNHIIQEGCDVMARDKHGRTPLHYAVGKQYIGCVKRLLYHKSDINILDKDGWSPLMLACKRGRLDIVQLLVEHGAKLNLKNSRGEVAAHCAACSGNADVLEYLLQNKANVNYTNEKGITPLILASMSANMELVKLVLRYKPRVNHIDGVGRTALHYCVENGSGKNSIANIHALIDAGADVDIQDKQSDAPFILAIRFNHPEALKCLVAAGCDSTAVDGMNGNAVVFAAMLGRTECVSILLDAGADADECGFAGITPLCISAFANEFDTLRLLIEKGNADVNIPSRCGAAPINKTLVIVNRGTQKLRHKCLAYLIRHGADVNFRIESVNYFTGITSGRNCVLSFAISSGYISLVRMLLIAGTKVSADECRQWKPTAENIMMGFVDLDKLLGEVIEWASQPRKLKNICRLSIRRSLNPHGICETLKLLPLPERMIEFLNYPELDMEPETCLINETYDQLKGILSPCALSMMGNGHPLDRIKIVGHKPT